MSDDSATAHTVSAIDPVGADPMIGRVLDGRYRIASRLGQGGMGIVYSARHEVLGSRVAIKVLRSDAAGDDEAIERLKREAQAASAVGNEHIVDVRDFGRLDDGSTYVVMELIEGIDLYNLVRSAPLPWKRARHVALQLCEALEAAHSQGIIHRDLKLENVLLTMRRGDPDFVKIVDFGIAKVQGTSKITVAGRVIGTPEYMSPEQCMGRTLDQRTDIYSLGVMLYEMVTGKLPFYDEDLAKLVRMQIQEKPVPPSRVRADLDLPLAFEAIILRCLAKDPQARFGSMRAVADALGTLDPGEVAAPAETDPSPAPAPEAEVARPRTTTTVGRDAPRRRWLAPVLGAVVLLSAGGVTAMIAMEDARPEPTAQVDVSPPAAPPERALEATEPPPPAADEAAPAPPTSVEVAAPAEITIESTPPRAHVFDDRGALLGQTPFLVRRPEPGQRLELVIREEGYEPHSIALSDLTAPELRVVLDRRAAAVRRRPPIQPPPALAPPVEPRPREDPPPEPRRHREFRDPWGDEE